MTLPHVILASSSPRRQQLLRQMGATFDVVPPDADETCLPDEGPIAMVKRLALLKAETVAEGRSSGVVLGSDTTVFLNGEVLGKPADHEEAADMLGRLSGNTHVVYTGFACIDLESGRTIVDHDEAEVTFRDLSPDEISTYVATGSSLDKAGAYGIQDDYGAVFINRICGDFYTVMGLPITKVYLTLRELGAEAARRTAVE